MPSPFYAGLVSVSVFIALSTVFHSINSPDNSPFSRPYGLVRMLRFMFDVNQPSLPTPFCSVLVSISVFMALSTVFHSINSSDNSPLSRPLWAGGDVTVYAFDINQPNLPTPFCSLLVSVSVCTALLTVFHSINSSDNSPLSRPHGLSFTWWGYYSLCP